MVNPLILATAGLKPGQIQDVEHRIYPRVDYVELKNLLEIDILNYDVYRSAPGKWFRSTETRLRSDLYLAFQGLIRSRRSSVVFALSERAGIPYAGIHRLIPGRRPFIFMLTCWSKRQERAFASLKLFESTDRFIVQCQSMKDHLVKLGANPARVKVIRYGIDHCFFRPQGDIEPRHGLGLSIGESRTRDYPSLFRAVTGMPVEMTVAASGSWYSREKKPGKYVDVPPNVTLERHIPSVELRNRYAQAQFVVLPILPSVASFGATAYLEAASMARPVIATRSPGLQDYIIDGVTGMFVEPGDVAGMRKAIQCFLDHPEEARRMGQNARLHIEQGLNLDRYVNELADQIEEFC